MRLKSRVEAENAPDLCNCELPGLEPFQRYLFQNSSRYIPALICQHIVWKNDRNGHKVSFLFIGSYLAASSISNLTRSARSGIAAGRNSID